MTNPAVRIEENGHVCTIILDRPAKRNAVDRQTAEALQQAFEQFEQNDRLRVAVLWGANGTFCSGADLTAMADPQTRNVVHPDGKGFGPMGPTRMMLSKPVIAAISGHAVAGGLELALWCDLRVAEVSAVFGVFCRRWGVPLIDGGTVRLPRIVGQSRAMDMILTGRAVDAQEAHQMGLANRLVPDGCARQQAEALAADIARFPQQCMKADRAAAYRQWELPMADALQNEGRHGYAVVQEESLAGAERFSKGAGRHGEFDR